MFRSFSVLLLCACLLCACSKAAPQGPSSTTLERKALMQIAFPGWTAKGRGQLQTLKVRREVMNSISPQAATDKSVGPVDSEELVKPLYVVRLADDQAVMITETHRPDEQNEPDTCHACSAGFGAYQFQRDGERWLMTRRDDVFTYAGSNGVASTSVIKLAASVYALAVESGGCWQGYCGSWLNLFELTARNAQALTDKALRTSADNSGARAECDHDASAQAAAGAEGEPASAEGCYEIDGKWAIDAGGPLPGALTLTFTGSRRVAQDGKLQAAQGIHDIQVLRYQSGRYVVASGQNPVPEI